jgi:hypothetical protein
MIKKLTIGTVLLGLGLAQAMYLLAPIVGLGLTQYSRPHCSTSAATAAVLRTIPPGYCWGDHGGLVRRR